MRASSPSLIESCEAPTTRTSPSTSSRSCSAASSTWLASFLALSATARAASSTAEPAGAGRPPAHPPHPPAQPERPAAGLGRHDGDVLRAEAEVARANLRERGAQPLSDGGRAGESRPPPRIRDPRQAGLERTAPGALDAVRQPDADIAALSS